MPKMPKPVSTYTLTANPNIILRDVDQAWIPADPQNLDYVAYQEWLTKGNTPNPYTPPGAAAQRPAALAHPPKPPAPAPRPGVRTPAGKHHG